MSKFIKYNDYVQVNPDERILSLTKEKKVILIDNILERSFSQGKGITITYDLSHSGRRINNRIYSTAGQQKGIDSLVSPYPKPILRNHDQGGEPIGRFVGGEWQNLYDEAVEFLQSNQAALEVQSAFASDDPDKIYKTMKSFNLIDNKKWPGLGRMRVQANITDEDAIKKFIDGRYLTFSAGSTTNRHVCSICSSDWAQDGMCEHRHGKQYDGDTCVFITGDFIVLEGSVVNTPADDLSQIISMELMDSLNDSNNYSSIGNVGEILLTDSVVNLEEIQKSKGLSDSKIADSAGEVPDNLKFDHSLSISTAAMKKLRTTGTVCIDACFKEEAIKVKINCETFNSDRLSEKHKVFFKQLRKDSIGDFDLDLASATPPSPNTTLLHEAIDTRKVFTMKEKETESLDEKILVEEVLEIQGDAQASSEKREEEDTEAPPPVAPEEEAKVLDDSEWEILDLALQGMLLNSENSLSDEERSELPESAFCGPNRTFPLVSRSHIDAAQKLLEKYSSAGNAKQEILESIAAKVEELQNNKANDYVELEEKFLILQKQHVDLENKFKTVLESILDKKEEKTKMDVEKEIADEVIDDKLALIDNKIESPSQHSQDETISHKKEKKLPAFEQKIVDEYKQIKIADGEYAAILYLQNKIQYLPRGFNPNKF